MAQKSLSKFLLSLIAATVVTCICSGIVAADGDRVEALEARIAELEILVHQLLQDQQQVPPPVESGEAEATSRNRG